jgi:hypothetical protein
MGSSAMAKIIMYCAASLLALTGCATEEKHRQVAELSRAQTLLGQAEQSGAQQYASADLEAARNKLETAQNKKTDDEVALRLAQESAADAEVAMARTRAAKAQQALNQVSAGSETLRQESSRQSGSMAPTTSAPPSTSDTMPSTITEPPPAQPGAQPPPRS